MYRFFKSQYIYLPNAHMLLIRTNAKRSKQTCSHCNFHHESIPKCINLTQFRNYTVQRNLAELMPPLQKKGRPKKERKYAELLEVTNQSSKAEFKQTMIKRLPKSELSVLVTGTNFQNAPEIPSGGELKCDELSDEILNEKDAKDDTEKDLKPLNYETSYSKLMKYFSTKSLKEINNKKYTMEGRMNAKERKSVQNLLIHMNVYLRCGMLDRAYSVFLWYRKVRTVKVKKFNDGIEMYNLIMEAYVAEKQLDKVLNIYRMLKKDKDFVQPNTKTFAVMFEATLKLLEKKQNEFLKEISSDMKAANITFDDIFNQTRFKLAQRTEVLKAINLIKPNYKPTYKMPDTKTDCKFFDKIQDSFQFKCPAEGLLTSKNLQLLLGKQIRAECQDEIVIKSINKNDEDEDMDERKRKIADLESYWETAVSEAFEKNLNLLKAKENAKPLYKNVLYPFLEVMDKSIYIKMILREIQYLGRNTEKYSTSLNTLFYNLGKSVYRKYMIQVHLQDGIVDKAISVYLKYVDWYFNPEANPKYKNQNSRSVWQQIEYEAKNEGASLYAPVLEWPRSLCVDIGAFLYNIIIHEIKVEINYSEFSEKRKIPAFYTLYRNVNSRLSEQIKPHPIITKLYKDTKSETLPFQATFVPSLIPPCPWVSLNFGGYLISKAELIRQHPNTLMNYEDCLQNIPAKQLYPMFDSLNQLSSIPWKVNIPVLDIVIKIFQEGGSEELDVPPSPSIVSLLPPLKEDASAEEKVQHSKENMKLKQKKANMYSLWCGALYTLSLANHLRDEIFWLPHNADFRGRTYPVPPHFNHLGSDLFRSLLTFAQPQPLGPKGLDWLKIHAINLTGFKKKNSIKERLDFANENLHYILDSAERPLTGERWWTKSDKPWQTLATCMEIANVLKSPNPETYMSNLPIHQDGSCNGLQHYAALGRDQIGAESVNLAPSDVPQDVYSTVASMIEEQREKDAKDGNEIARLLKGYIQRKVIKQTVMTTVYGVTRYGARYQIANQLIELKEFPENKVWKASLYLVEKTFDTLRTMFTSAKEIQDWFTLCASIICSIYGESVEWITPIGLPVMQPYVTEKLLCSEHNIKEYALPAKLKQRNAFPPNFIHSLDSTHMMLTSIHCEHAGITFVSVHDCFWTHPSTVEIMNKICREQFVALHSEPILENLSQYFCKKYAENMSWVTKKPNLTQAHVKCCFTTIPQRGQFDLKNVLSSVYFFS